MWRRRPRSSQDFLPYYMQTQWGIPWWIPSLVPCNPDRRSSPCTEPASWVEIFSSKENTGGSAVNITLCHQVGSQYIYDMYSLVHGRLSSAFHSILTRRLSVNVCQGTSCQVYSITSAQKKYERMPQMALENQWLFYRDGWWVRYQNLKYVTDISKTLMYGFIINYWNHDVVFSV